MERVTGHRFPILLNGLVEVLLRGDDFPRAHPSAAAAADSSSDSDEGTDGDRKNASKFVNGDDDLNTSDFDRGGKNSDAAPKDHLLDASCDGTGVSWQDLADPAARVWAACRPCDANQLRAIDAIFGEMFRVRL